MSSVSQGLRIYCGSKQPPSGTRKGAPLDCFRKGIAIGKRIGKTETNILAEKKAKTKQKAVEAITSVLSKKKVATDISNLGITALKTQIHLNDLNKDEIRGIAVRLSKSDARIPRYSQLTKAELVQELVKRGFQL